MLICCDWSRWIRYQSDISNKAAICVSLYVSQMNNQSIKVTHHHSQLNLYVRQKLKDILRYICSGYLGYLQVFFSSYYNDITWVTWCVKSPPSSLFVQQLVRANNQEITAPVYWPFVRGTTDHQYDHDVRSSRPLLQCDFFFQHFPLFVAAHPSCMDYSEELARRARNSPWQCIDCKTCYVCSDSGDADAMLFCDACDKGYHMQCHNPPIREKPTGRYWRVSCGSH